MSSAIAKKKSADNAPAKKRTEHKSASALIRGNPVFSGTKVIQRKASCACGGGCPTCLETLGVQAKLKIGAPNDVYEQEADRVADQVMGMTEPKVQKTSQADANSNGTNTRSSVSKADVPVQRQEEPEQEGERGVQIKLRALNQPQRQPETDLDEDEEEDLLQAKATPGYTPQVTPSVAANIQNLKGGGQPLPPNQRHFFESRMGQDFSGVRIHTDSKAADTAQTIQAKAFTLGNNIVFNTGQYSHDNQEGKKLLAHELTHVVQQGQSKASYNTAAEAETEADHTASQAVMGQSVTISAGVPAGVQRKPLHEEELELEIAEIDKKIEENEAQVVGVSLPEAEEQRLFEERTQLLENRAELQAQRDSLTSEDPNLQDSGRRRATFKKLNARLKEQRSYPGREADQADFNAAKPFVEKDRKKEEKKRKEKEKEERMKEWSAYEREEGKEIPPLERFWIFMEEHKKPRRVKEKTLGIFPFKDQFYTVYDPYYWRSKDEFKKTNERAEYLADHGEYQPVVGEIAGRPVSARNQQQYRYKEGAAELGQLYDNLFAVPIEIATGVYIAAPIATALLETGVVVSETAAAAALEVHVTVAVYGVSLTAAQQLARSAYTFYLRNAIGINQAIVQGTEITIDLFGGDTGPISPGDSLNFADDAVAAARKAISQGDVFYFADEVGKGTYRAVKAKVTKVDALGAVHTEVLTVEKIPEEIFRNKYGSGKKIHHIPNQDLGEPPGKTRPNTKLDEKSGSKNSSITESRKPDHDIRHPKKIQEILEKNRPARNPTVQKKLQDDINNYRSNANIRRVDQIESTDPVQGGTVAVGRTDIPGLHDKPFGGASPKAVPFRVKGKPGTLSEAFEPANPISQGHAEHLVVENLHLDIQRRLKAGTLTRKNLEGKEVWIRVEQEPCSSCAAGLSDPSKTSGVLKQFSETYPELTIEVRNARTSRSFLIKNGKILD